MSLELTIITADQHLHYSQVTRIILPTPQGQLGVLPGHTWLVSLVDCGVLRVFLAGSDKAAAPHKRPLLLALSTGLAKISSDHVILLMNDVRQRDAINHDHACARSLEIARARSGESALGPAERQDLEEEAAFLNAQLTLIDMDGGDPN